MAVKEVFFGEKINSILVNPRLIGLPYSGTITLFLFIIVVCLNLSVAIYLEQTRKEINAISVNLPSINEIGDEFNCDSLTFSEKIGFSFNSTILFFGTKVLGFYDIQDTQNFNILEHTLSTEQLDLLQSECSNDFNFEIGSSSFCLNSELLTFAEERSSTSLPQSKILFSRASNDLFFKLFISDNTEYTIFITSVNDEIEFNINIGVLVNTELIYDFTIFPKFTDQNINSIELNRIIFDILSSIGGNNIEEFIGVALSNRPITCQTEQGLGVFAYFALLFDFSFLLEGLFTFVIAFAILRYFSTSESQPQIEAKKQMLIKSFQAKEDKDKEDTKTVQSVEVKEKKVNVSEKEV